MDFRCCAGALLLAAAPLLHAGEAGADDPDDADSNALGPIVITATRSPRPQSATLAPNTVITRADIERSQADSVQELLRNTPSLSVANQGGDGKITSLFLRGANADEVLVLVDGVRYGDATSGLAAIQNLPVGQIERIEIVRGPRSSLYGADAIGGVIQIFTRGGEGVAGDQPYASVGAGGYGTREAQVGLAGSSAQAHYNASLSARDSDGFNACRGRPFSAPGGGAGCFADQPDDDGYKREGGSLHAGYRFDNGLALGVHVLRTDSETEFDGIAANQLEATQEVFGGSASGRVLDPWLVTLSIARSRDDQISFFEGAFANHFETERDSATLQNDIRINANNRVTLGLDYRLERVQLDRGNSLSGFKQTRRDNKGVFAQYIGIWGRNELQLALRGDDNEQFGGHTTGSLVYGLHLTDVYTVSASYGTAFQAPTFNDLYYPDTPGFPPASNPDLDPEESESFELGLDAERRWGRWSLHAYQTRIDDLIALDANFTPQNISQARIRGVEVQADAYIGAWNISANADYLDAENRSGGPNRGNALPRRPEYSARLDLDRRFGRFSAGAGLFAAGARYDDSANTTRLDDYALVEVRGSVQLNPDWRLQARISNLLDEDYETVAFYNQPGRSLFVTLRYQP